MKIVRLFSILFLFYYSYSGFGANKLLFAIDLIRHGDRTPIVRLPTVSYKWSQGLGQLTATGMEQEYELGKTFRKRYIEEASLLPPSYDGKMLYAYSTDYDRTLMSAESLLMGLYPLGTGPTLGTGKQALPGGFQPIPIHTAPKETNFLVPHINDTLERELLEKYVYTSTEWKQKEKELKGYFSKWNQASGLHTFKLEHLIVLADTLKIYEQHHIPLPRGLTKDDIKTIEEAGSWAFLVQGKPYELQKARFYPLINQITRSFQEAQTKPLRYILLSGHDLTILGVLAALGAPLSHSVPYAADLNLSLYETEKKELIVSVKYNGTPVRIPHCGADTCTLKQFAEIATLTQAK